MQDANDGGSVFVTRSLTIPAAELEWRFSRSGGPGGQHANKTSSRAEVRFDIAASTSLGPRQRTRLLDRFGPEIRVVADDERSQARNRALRVGAPRRAPARRPYGSETEVRHRPECLIGAQATRIEEAALEYQAPAGAASRT